MTLLLEFATVLVVIAVLMTLLPLGILAYYSTGAPAARHELYTVTAAQVLVLNGGPITVSQRARGFGSSLLQGLNPTRWTTVDYPGWAHEVLTEADRSQGAHERAAIYRLLAQAAHHADGVDRLSAREQRLIDRTVRPDELAGATSMEQLRTTFGAQQRARWQTLVRHPSEWADVSILGPVIGRGLDYIGRGTALGLLFGALFSTKDDLLTIVETVGLTSLLGGALGSVVFAGYLNKRLPSLTRAGREPTWLERVRRRYPYLTAAALPVLIAVAFRVLLDTTTR